MFLYLEQGEGYEGSNWSDRRGSTRLVRTEPRDAR